MLRRTLLFAVCAFAFALVGSTASDAQAQGYGRAAMLRVIDHARAKGFEKLTLSFVPDPQGPELFYLSLGFQHTGRVDEGEVVLELPLKP